MKQYVMTLIISLICFSGALLIKGQTTSRDIGKICTVEIKNIYKSPEFFGIVVEDVVLGDRYIIETSNHSLSNKDCTNEFVEIFPKEPKLIHVGDTLQVELTPKYEFMQSMIGVSYMRFPDSPAYHW